jgi:hypothetical protein
MCKAPLTVNKSVPPLWQNDLQLNLEIWKQIAQHADPREIIVSRNPLKLNIDYIEMFVEKAKTHLNRCSQHDLLIHSTSSS